MPPKPDIAFGTYVPQPTSNTRAAQKARAVAVPEDVRSREPSATADDQDLYDDQGDYEDEAPSTSKHPQTQEETHPREDAPEERSLADVIAMLAEAINNGQFTHPAAPAPAVSAPRKRTPKVKEPDTFDGSDPHKLYPFIVQCGLYFSTNPDLYANSETDRVTFALSYLRGTAAQWFEPQLLNLSQVRPRWLDRWPLFEAELSDNFGPVDPVADAEAELNNLVMHDHHKLMKYNVAFNRLAARVQWGDAALVHRFYKGLCNRIKDAMMDGAKPSTLTAMRVRAQAIDQRHWECEGEKTRSQGKSSDGKKSTNNGGSSSSSHNQNHNSGNSGGNSSSGKNSGSSKSKSKDKPDRNASSSNSNSRSSKSATPDLSSKLTKDGKLTTDERTRRMENQLCLFCGHAGHKRDECNKRKASEEKAKARAAKVTSDAAGNSEGSSKKS